jgi:hypothetical protein
MNVVDSEISLSKANLGNLPKNYILVKKSGSVIAEKGGSKIIDRELAEDERLHAQMPKAEDPNRSELRAKIQQQDKVNQAVKKNLLK